MVKVIHFGTNRFLIYEFAPFSHNTERHRQTDKQTQHSSISATHIAVGWKSGGRCRRRP